MTAGRGIIHGENVATKGKVRLLQLWLTLPKSQRWTTPAFQDIRADAVPVRREPGVEVRVYSGASGRARSTTRNHVPVTLTEIAMEPARPSTRTFLRPTTALCYVIRGSVASVRRGAAQRRPGGMARPSRR